MLRTLDAGVLVGEPARVVVRGETARWWRHRYPDSDRTPCEKTMMRRSAISLAVATSILGSGCGSPPEATSTTETVDSAGVRLVTSLPNSAAELVLEDLALALGEGESQENQFYRLADARLLPDGSVVTAEWGSGEVRRFDRDGVLRSTRGGRGEGPGEFARIQSLQFLPGEFLRVLDVRLQRGTVFDSAWSVRSTSPFAPPAVDRRPAAVNLPGAALAFTSTGRVVGFPNVTMELSGMPGPVSAEALLSVSESQGAPRGVLGNFRLVSFYETPGGLRPFGSVPGAPILKYDVRDLRLALTEGRSHDIAVVDDGVLTMRIRESRARTALSLPDTFEIPPADSLPAYTEVKVDADGRIWARPGVAEGSETAVWRRFSPLGALEATLELGSTDHVYDARGDTVLLRRLDELDVERLEIWTIASRASDGPS